MHVTMTEYFAALGWPDPSSLETRTPRNQGQFVVHEELTSNERDIYIYIYNPNAKGGQKMINQQ